MVHEAVTGRDGRTHNQKESMTEGMTKNERRAFLLGQIELAEKLKAFAEDGILLLKNELAELEKSI